MERRKSFLTTESDMEEFKNIVASILTPTGTQSKHIYLKHLQTTNTNAFNDLCIQGYGATSTGDPFNAIHGDLVTEHFNRETKGTAGPNRAGYISNENTVNKWIMTLHIHSQLPAGM